MSHKYWPPWLKTRAISWHAKEALRGGRGIAVSILSLALQRSTPGPGHFTLKKESQFLSSGGWVGLRASVDRSKKSHPNKGVKPQTIQPIASSYTDYTILAALTISSKILWNEFRWCLLSILTNKKIQNNFSV